MAKQYETIEPALVDFLRRQHLFFVASAPLGADGHVNLSPKGHDTFAVLDERTVAYLDLTGSGIETIAHLRENGRITLLFCAFEGPPKIVRLYGRGEVVEKGEPAFEALRPHFPAFDGARAIVRVQVTRVSDSCGYSVPLYDFVGERKQLLEWADRKGAEGLETYREKNNAASIDGLAGLRPR
jgi:hypothetical protein